MDTLTLLDQIQGIARTGLHYSTDPYDRERYEHLLKIALTEYEALFGVEGESLRERFSAEVGYITPKIGADAAIFNDKGEILVMERADGSGWCLPCGWVEPGERPCETAVREAFEETGLIVEVRKLVGVFSRIASGRSDVHSMSAVVHICEVVGGELKLSHEGSALKYVSVDADIHWHNIHQKYARHAHKMWLDDSVTAVSC